MASPLLKAGFICSSCGHHGGVRFVSLPLVLEDDVSESRTREASHPKSHRQGPSDTPPQMLLNSPDKLRVLIPSLPEAAPTSQGRPKAAINFESIHVIPSLGRIA